MNHWSIFSLSWWEALFKSPKRCVATFFVIYAFLAVVVIRPSSMTLTNGDEPHYLIMTHSLVTDHDTTLDNNYDPRVYAAWFDFPIEPHLYRLGERVVSFHSFALSFLIAPGFIVAGRMGAVLTMAALIALSISSLYTLCNRIVSSRSAAAVTLLAAFSLPVLAYSQAIYPDTVAFVLVVFLTRICWDLEQKYRGMLVLLAFMCMSLLPWLHIRFAILAVGYCIYLLWILAKQRKLTAAVPYLLIPVIAAVLYWLRIRIGYDVSLLEFLHARSAWSNGTITVPSTGVIGMLLDRSSGLLMFAPVYVFSFWGLSYGLKHSRKYILPIVFTGLVYFLFMGSWFEWSGGFSPPQRYLVAIMPVFVVGLAIAHEHFLLQGRALRYKFLRNVTLSIAMVGTLFPIMLLPIGHGNNFAHALSTKWFHFNALLPNLIENLNWLTIIIWIVIFASLIALPIHHRKELTD